MQYSTTVGQQRCVTGSRTQNLSIVETQLAAVAPKEYVGYFVVITSFFKYLLNNFKYLSAKFKVLKIFFQATYCKTTQTDDDRISAGEFSLGSQEFDYDEEMNIMDKHLDINFDESPTREIANILPSFQFKIRQQLDVNFVNYSKHHIHNVKILWKIYD